MFHIFAITDENIVKIEPGYDNVKDAEKDVQNILKLDKVVWGKHESGPGGEPNTWRAWHPSHMHFFHIVPNGTYPNFVEGRLA